MSDDKSITGNTAVERINVHEPDNIRDWARRLEVGEEQLKETIQQVGTSVNAIKKVLRGRPIQKT
jgi:hypothetical protein